jgi:hypothetical protein
MEKGSIESYRDKLVDLMTEASRELNTEQLLEFLVFIEVGIGMQLTDLRGRFPDEVGKLEKHYKLAAKLALHEIGDEGNELSRKA